jgi:hypothetical protein
MKKLNTFPISYLAALGLCSVFCHRYSPEPLQLKGAQPQELYSVSQNVMPLLLDLFSFLWRKPCFSAEFFSAYLLSRRAPN